jgi:serine/threonine protein kinase
MYDAREIGLEWQGTLQTLSGVAAAKSCMETVDNFLRTPGRVKRCFLKIEDAVVPELKGRLQWAKRQEGSQSQDVLVKRSKQHTKEEAVMQWLCHKTLSEIHLGHHCPRVYDVFTRADHVWFSMEPIYNAPILQAWLQDLPYWKTPHPANGIAILQIVSQIAMCCAVLQSHLGFNHRDLKLDNILVKLDAVREHTFRHVTGLEIHLKPSPTAVLVDFGFACFGEGKHPWIQSGQDALSQMDTCPRTGRDVFMLLVFLLWEQDVRASLVPEHLDFFMESLKLTQSRFQSLMKLSYNPISWIYNLITEKDFSCPALDSWTWLQSCVTKFPEVGLIKIQPSS